MNFMEFRRQFFELACFTVHQVHAWNEGFDKNNLTRWTKQNLVLRLRKGLYAFPEYLSHPNFTFFVSNYIYKPSYVSLYAALAFYDIVPEAVVEITAVSALKTASFDNAFGSFTYRTIKPELMFGYNIMPLGDRSIRLAQPEKAILDLLYLYPFYDTESEIENLRFDEYFMFHELDAAKMLSYLNRFNNRELSKRVKILMKFHEIRTD
jgi:predicted transcriptional regulator of viral defense system